MNSEEPYKDETTDEAMCSSEEQADGIPTISHATKGSCLSTVLADGVAAEKKDFKSPLRMPFSVYTATNGYAWSNIPEGSDLEGLDFYYQKAVERKPDFLSPGDVVKGVFARDGNVAAFRIQMVKHWDSFGRNADYCAFAFLTYEQAWMVDFSTLLDMPEFTNPQHEPPKSITYSGEASKDVNSENSIETIKKLYKGESLQSFDFSKIGALLSAHGNKSAYWLFCKVECAIENSTTISTGSWNADPYPPPPPAPSPLITPSQQLPIQEDVVEPPISSLQTIRQVVASPEMRQAPQSCSSDSPLSPQVINRTFGVDASHRTRASITPVQAGSKSPLIGQSNRVRGNICVMSPTIPEEMNRMPVQKSIGFFGFDTLTMVLMGVVAALVVALVVFIILFIMSRNASDHSYRGFVGVESVNQELEGVKIRKQKEKETKIGYEKGGR